MSHHNPHAKQLIKVLHGFMIELDKPCLDAINYISGNYHPMYKDLDGDSNGGDSIRYGFRKTLLKWKSFDETPKLQTLPNKFKPAFMDHWGTNDILSSTI